VDEVIDLVGLRDVAYDRAGGFSLGMGQRLGIASALLGDPRTLILDEPVNGLDPEGVRWIRDLLKGLAQEGRTVFLSSHLMSEMAMTAEQLIVVGRGRLIRDTSVAEFIASASSGTVRVRTPDEAALRDLLLEDGATVASSEPGHLEVSGMTSDEIGYRAAGAGLTLLELAPVEASLEEAFMALTHDAVEFRTPDTAAPSTDGSLERIAS
jgi:ABC-2 type transport system ATP-binding protein